MIPGLGCEAGASLGYIVKAYLTGMAEKRKEGRVKQREGEKGKKRGREGGREKRTAKRL